MEYSSRSVKPGGRLRERKATVKHGVTFVKRETGESSIELYASKALCQFRSLSQCSLRNVYVEGMQTRGPEEVIRPRDQVSSVPFIDSV